MEIKQITNLLQGLIGDYLAINPTEIEPKDSLSNLGADSLDVIQIILEIELKFNVHIPDDELTKLETVHDLAAFIANSTGIAWESGYGSFN